MKIFLMYNYKMINPIINKKHKQTYIKDCNRKYVLYEVPFPDEIKELYIVMKKYLYHSMYNKIITNINGEVVTSYKNRNYVLIEIISKEQENIRGISEIIYVDNNVNYLLDRSNWYFLWSKKNDYIEKDYKRIEGKNIYLDESIDYYIGLAENAITYLNVTENTNNNLIKCISHKRITENNTHNPLNIVIDIRERDISEYIKYLFFSQKITEKKLEEIISYILETKLSKEKIYGRLLYPTYFFDIYDIIEENENATLEISKIIKRVDEYEKLLINFYTIVSKKTNIKKIDWLN